MGFSAEVLVIGKAESHDGAESTLTLTVRVVRTMTTYATYEAFEAAYQGRNYAALESAWAGARYIDMERKPLIKEVPDGELHRQRVAALPRSWGRHEDPVAR